MPKLRGIVFDLDDTLFPVASLPPGALAGVLAAARSANVGPDALPSERLEHALADASRHPFPVVVADHALPLPIVQAWAAAQEVLEINAPIAPYEDVLPVLSRLPHQRFLVTTGFRRFQESKIAALGLAHLFDGIYIDAVDTTGAPVGKAAVFRRLLSEWDLAPHATLVVGDSERNELAAGRSLGMPTVQLLRPGVTRTEAVDWHIAGLIELPALIRRLEGEDQP